MHLTTKATLIHNQLQWLLTTILRDQHKRIYASTIHTLSQSLVQTYEAFIHKGKPSKVYLVSVIGSQQGVDYVTSNIPDADLWIGVVDQDLDSNGYIVPGLGDAGDLSVGAKV